MIFVDFYDVLVGMIYHSHGSVMGTYKKYLLEPLQTPPRVSTARPMTAGSPSSGRSMSLGKKKLGAKVTNYKEGVRL